MDINYNRNRVQVFFENVVDPNYDPLEEDKEKRKAFQKIAESHILTTYEMTQIEPLLIQDANDYLYSALVSFFNALQNLTLQNCSWATVELYYSVYYLCRAKLHYERKGIIRANGQIYYLDNNIGNTIEKIDNKKHGTHDGTMLIFKKLFPNDIILSNTIDFMDSIEWIKTNREIANYLSVKFIDPDFFPFYDKYKNISLIQKNIKLLIGDISLAFQPEFAMIGLPIILFKEIIKDYSINLPSVLSYKNLKFILVTMRTLGIDYRNIHLV